jgi:hypothetical protein
VTAFCICGRTERLGRIHNCLHPIGPRWGDAPPPVTRASDLANADPSNRVANDMANASTKPGLNRSSPTYRYRNPEKRRDYMSAYMRAYRKRATARAA